MPAATAREKPLASIIILNYDGRPFIDRCIDSVLMNTYPNFEILLVDNASTDGSAEYVKKKFCSEPRIKVIALKKNLGFAAGNNIGFQMAKGKYLIALNNDTEVDPNWLTELIRQMESDHTIGAVQSKLLLMDNRRIIDSTGGYIYLNLFGQERGSMQIDNGQYDKNDEIFYAKGASICLRKEILKEIGGFDETYFMYYEETDLCWRMWLRGYRVVFVPKSVVYHKNGGVARAHGTTHNYYMTRNRPITLIKNYELTNVIIYLPTVLLTEGLKILKVALLRKKNLESIRAMFWVLTNLNSIIIKRREVQRLRVLKDKQLINRVIIRRCVLPI